MTFPRTTAIEPGASRSDVAWMLRAGFAVPLGEGTAINLARRNTDLGAVRRDGLDGEMCRSDEGVREIRGQRVGSGKSCLRVDMSPPTLSPIR